MFEYISKYWPVIVTVFATVGGLSTVLIVLRTLFPRLYANKLKPALERILGGLKGIDKVIDTLRMTDKDNLLFETLDEAVDYLIKELKEAGVTATEADVLATANIKPDGLSINRSKDGWLVDFGRRF